MVEAAARSGRFNTAADALRQRTESQAAIVPVTKAVDHLEENWGNQPIADTTDDDRDASGTEPPSTGVRSVTLLPSA
ncbi:hypothetical protein GCM10023320_41090 [Pseudonocardia adelaidensis]|uniref:Antitoxin ParD1/3/4 n=1 Tax=Pseudonocardia adelaidensis TaxID=648754 RepID=A0ABP9NPW4_9PSEU